MQKSSNDILKRAQTLLSKGLFNESLDVLQHANKKTRLIPDYTFLLAACYANLGDFNNAEKYFTRTVELSPTSFHAWSNLGLSQLHQKKYDQAIKSFRKSHSINQDYYDALYNLALAYYQAGDIPNSIQYANITVDKNPEKPQAHNVLGLCYQKSDAKKAISHFKNAIAINPEYFESYHNLIDTYILYSQFRDAESLILSIMPRYPGRLTLYTTLGQLYEKQKNIQGALQVYNQGLVIYPDDVTLLSSKGRSLILSNELEKGIDTIDRALTISPYHTDSIIEKYSYFILSREYDDAYNILNNYIKNCSGAVDARVLISFANACKSAGHEQEGIDVLSELTSKDITKEAMVGTRYILGDIYDKRGDYDKAFDNYSIANNISYKNPDINYYIDIMTSIIDNLDATTLQSLPVSSIISDSPVFIVGMPRSGTTLVEQILSAHPNVYGAGEITDLWAIGNNISDAMNLFKYTTNLKNISKKEIEQYAETYINRITSLSRDHSRCTDKLPHNFFHIGLIELLFPNAKIVHCSRNPIDTCLSIYFKNFNDNHMYARNLSDLAAFYKQYVALMQHWASNSSINIYHIKYDELVTQPGIKIRELIDYIGLEWNEQCLQHQTSRRTIMTPSYDQASKPIYKDSLSRWKNYEHHITPLIEALGDI